MQITDDAAVFEQARAHRSLERITTLLDTAVTTPFAAHDNRDTWTFWAVGIMHLITAQIAQLPPSVISHAAAPDYTLFTRASDALDRGVDRVDVLMLERTFTHDLLGLAVEHARFRASLQDKPLAGSTLTTYLPPALRIDCAPL